ncbi:CBD9-like protein [Lindgomyces ingoldianus]|uniref:CBD9-like protein n=1 Tax=Lindgomyces ingoldianus TaxID=673940 RepID=A0ACB6QRZ7_9PLEO|nr:CBD9-like protein [Lindgomyces ingoldianus]KAF2469343.1 CBD9-like protein [Lindgomyces ingoldianus]
MFGFSCRFQRGVAILTLVAICPSLILAQAPPASTFYLSETETQFSLNIANDSSDVFIYFTSPAYSWVGVGFGQEMRNSLMFVLYPSQDGKNVTISPRIATGHSEPSFAKDIQFSTLPGTGITDDMFVLKAVCHNCRVWPGGFIDVKTTVHPMIYAFGPGNRLQSNGLNAPLKRHIRYGKFTMDMLVATGKGEVPTASTALNGVQLKGGMVRDHDRMNLAHAVLGCLALFVLWPLNLIFAGFVKRIGIHVGISVFIIVFLIIAYALGIATSGEYNRSKTFNSPHQIIAFISILPILLMSLLPIPRLSRLSPTIPRLHNPAISFTFTILTLTGGLGLHLSSQGMPIILAYTAVALAVFCFLMLLQTCIRRRGSAYAIAKGMRRVREEDEQDLVLAAYYAGQKLDDESRAGSAASLNRPSPGMGPGTHGRSGSGGNGNIYGGGQMPGPQYLLNMHPGVPVHRW